MSRLSQLDRDALNVLRISQDQTQDDPEVRRVNFEISIPGETTVEYQASFSALGLPESLDIFEQGEIEEPQFQLPSEVVAFLGMAAEQMRDRTLWLDVDSLDRHLAIVPWELLLQKQVLLPDQSPVNILRVPDLLFQPASFGRTTNIVLCASERQGAAGESRWRDLARLIQHIYDTPHSNRVRVHVFTDKHNSNKLADQLSSKGYVDPNYNVIRYNPDRRASYSQSEAATQLLLQQGQFDNEWLTWIANELRDVTVDVVHFFCDGCLTLEQGGLVFSSSPWSEADSQSAAGSQRERFANAQQIDFFLTRIGAYSVALTATRDCSSVVGLRLLSTQLGRIRTGPVLLHYAERDESFDDICIAYRFLYTNVQRELELSPALTLHCAPTLIHKDLEQTSLKFSESLTYLWKARDFLQIVTGERDESPRAEYEEKREGESLAWAIAAYRFMEKMAAGLDTDESSFEADEARQALRGVREAINLAADSVHAQVKLMDERSR